MNRERSTRQNLTRADLSRAKATDHSHKFLERSGRPVAARVRDLIELSLSHYNDDYERNRLRRDLQGNAMERAFWELYLHEAYRRSGFVVTPHPEIDGTKSRIDFLMTRNGHSFYLEATTANPDEKLVSESRRLGRVFDSLRDTEIANYSIHIDDVIVGSSDLARRRLIGPVQNWLERLTAGQAERHYLFQHEGWSIPMTAHIWPGSGASEIDRFSINGDERLSVNGAAVVQRIHDKYSFWKDASLNHPLVVAVRYPTSRIHGSPDSTFSFDSPECWQRYPSLPHVVTVENMLPWHVETAMPRLWINSDTSIAKRDQPSWLLRGEMFGRQLPAGKHLGVT